MPWSGVGSLSPSPGVALSEPQAAARARMRARPAMRPIMAIRRPRKPAGSLEPHATLAADDGALGLGRLLELLLEVGHPLLQVGVGRGQDPYGEQTGVPGTAD